MRGRRRLLAIAVGVLGALVALEVVLQIGAFVIARRGSDVPGAGGDGQRVVLCVGDSFTYGLGASTTERSYPRVLEAELRTTGDSADAWTVSNCGWPGSTSADVLRKLPGQLAAYRPRLVYVLTGYNDFWSGPDVDAVAAARAASDGADVGAFRFELRTWKLLTMIWHAVTSPAEADPVAGGGATSAGGGQRPVDPVSLPFVGEWHDGALHVTFEPSGHLQVGESHLNWSYRDDALWLEPPETGEEIAVDWQLEDGRLVLASALWPVTFRLAPGPPTATPAQRGERALRDGDLDTARAEFVQCLDDPAAAVAGHEGLARVDARTGRRDDAREHAEWLRAHYAARPDHARGRAAVRTFLALDDVDTALAVVGSMLAELPIQEPEYVVLRQHGLRATDRDAVLASLDRALARDDVDSKLRAALLGVRIVLAGAKPDDVMRGLLEATLLLDDASLLQRTVRERPDELNRARCLAALDALELSAADRDRLLADFDDASTLGANTQDVLEANLHAIVTRCREAGATPVLLVYPNPKQAVHDTVRCVATAASVDWLDVRAHFERLLETSSRDDWFILDGHCNDRGYAEMGKLVAADARARVAR